MRIFRSLLAGMTLLLAVIAGALFSIQNTASISLDLLFIELPARPVSLWLLLMLGIGLSLGLVASTGLIWRQKAALLKQQRENSRLQVELERLRRAGVTSGE